MRWRVAVLLGLAPVGTETGHLIAYEARFGAAAQQLQSSGAHAYLPTVVKTAVGVAALALLGSLALIALARAVSRGASVRAADSPSYLGLLAALFTIQLALFVSQEVIEAAVAGLPVDSATTLMLWGAVGQLPAAALLAAALHWLMARVERAAAQLRAIDVTVRWVVPAAPLALVPVRGTDHNRWIAARAPQPRRGPPHSS